MVLDATGFEDPKLALNRREISNPDRQLVGFTSSDLLAIARRRVPGEAPVRPIGNDGAVSEHVLRIYTIGHSNHQSDHVVTLLEEHAIEAVVDVRSSPWSRFAPQFNRETLERTLSRQRVRQTAASS